MNIRTKNAIAKRGYDVDGSVIGSYRYETRSGWNRVELWRSLKSINDYEYIGFFGDNGEVEYLDED